MGDMFQLEKYLPAAPASEKILSTFFYHKLMIAYAEDSSS